MEKNGNESEKALQTNKHIENPIWMHFQASRRTESEELHSMLKFEILFLLDDFHSLFCRFFMLRLAGVCAWLLCFYLYLFVLF